MQEDYIVIGKIGAPYGVKGWLKINSFSTTPTNILNYDVWYFEKDGRFEPIAIESRDTQGQTSLIKLTGIQTPEKARLLTGKLIYIKQSDLPSLKKGDYYWSELEGLTVINQHHEILGNIVNLMETGSNDILIIKKGKNEFAIPYLPGTVILDVNLEKKEMHVNWDII